MNLSAIIIDDKEGAKYSQKFWVFKEEDSLIDIVEDTIIEKGEGIVNNISNIDKKEKKKKKRKAKAKKG